MNNGETDVEIPEQIADIIQMLPQGSSTWRLILLAIFLLIPSFGVFQDGYIALAFPFILFGYSSYVGDLSIWVMGYYVQYDLFYPQYLLIHASMILPKLLISYLLDRWSTTANKSRFTIPAIFIQMVAPIFISILMGGITYPLNLIATLLYSLRYLQLNADLKTKEKPQEPVVKQVSEASTQKDEKKSSRKQVVTTRISQQSIAIKAGHDVAGQNIKIGIKVENNTNLAIMNVRVNLDTPDGLEYVKGSTPSQKIGNIAGGGFQSAIFWLKPLRCIDNEYAGVVTYRNAKNESKSIEIPPKRITNICPMLGETENARSIFRKLKFGSMKRNCASFEFNGNAKTVYELAKTRLVGMQPVDQSEQVLEDESFLGYSCYVGETKYGESHFAAEIQATGSSVNGVLTLSIYSEDERILSGFIVDIMGDVREHVQILQEKTCELATCPKCGADIDLEAISEEGVYHCQYCGVASKAAPWLV